MDTEHEICLTACETMVMQVIWHTSYEMTAKEVLAKVNQKYGKEWKIQTVSTFIRRLVQKNYLEMRRKGRQYTYRPLITALDGLTQYFKDAMYLWGDDTVKQFALSQM